MSQQLLGMVYIKVDGSLLPSLPGAKLDMGGVTRTTVMGDNAVLGFARQPKQSVVECEIGMREGVSLAALQKIEDATITFECDTGQTYVIRGAYVTETLNLTAGEGGKVALKFEGQPAEEMSA